MICKHWDCGWCIASKEIDTTSECGQCCNSEKCNALKQQEKQAVISKSRLAPPDKWHYSEANNPTKGNKLC